MTHTPEQDRPRDEGAPEGAEHPESVAVEPASRLSRREMMAVAVALLGGGTVTFALMIGSGGSKPAAPAPGGSGVDGLAPALADAPIDTPRWRHANREWLSNARRGLAVEVYADSKVPIWQRKAHPILVVRCQANRTEAFVFIESAAKIERQDEKHTVTLGFDDEPELTERWPDSEEHDALFAPDGAAFVRRLTGAARLRFGYTPHNAGPVVATFSTAGLSDLIAPAARQCAPLAR